jgi:small multidrug resistance pump
MMSYWMVLCGAIATSLVGQTLLKAGSGAPSFMAQLFDWRTLVGLVLYGGAAMLYIVVYRLGGDRPLCVS